MKIIDMLNPQHTNMMLREDPQQGVFVEGLEERAVYTLPEALEVVNSALENRVMASTLMVIINCLFYYLLVIVVFFLFNVFSECYIKSKSHHFENETATTCYSKLCILQENHSFGYSFFI